MDEHKHVALPKLHGAPAYARPSVPHAQVERPFDPDGLPLAIAMSEEGLEVLEQATASEREEQGPATEQELTARPFSLRAIADRLGARRG